MKQGSTLFLKSVLVLLGLTVLGMCGFILPEALSNENVGDYRFLVFGLCVASIPFFIALFQSWKLLSYIDKNTAFSQASVKALNNIKYCALTISGLFAAGMPYIFDVADKDDAPGVVAMALIIIFASIVIAAFAALLQKLLQNAIDIKSENDLTV